tara:strand:- start:586 stop:1197 length:612 start_codon:yes stop_codon:yes gene_type:complete
MEENTSSTWTPDVIRILEKIRINSVNFSRHHKKKYFFYKTIQKWFRLPTIILSAIGSVSSVGLQAYIEQSHISALVCFLSLSVGVLNSIELYLKITDNIENELNNSKAYYTLAIDIEKTTKLDAPNRQINAIKYLDAKYSTFQKLTEQSNPMSQMIDVLAGLPPKEKKNKNKKKQPADDASSSSSLESEPTDTNIDTFLESNV